MQFNIQNNAKIVFLQVEAPELLNLRRKEIGLEPFSCYVNSVTTQSKLPAEWPLGVLYDPAICKGPYGFLRLTFPCYIYATAQSA